MATVGEMHCQAPEWMPSPLHLRVVELAAPLGQAEEVLLAGLDCKPLRLPDPAVVSAGPLAAALTDQQTELVHPPAMGPKLPRPEPAEEEPAMRPAMERTPALLVVATEADRHPPAAMEAVVMEARMSLPVPARVQALAPEALEGMEALLPGPPRALPPGLPMELIRMA